MEQELTLFVINILSSVAVSSLLATALIFLTKSWISTRLKSSIQHEYDQKITAYQAKLKAEQDVALLELRSLVEKDSNLQKAAHSSLHQVQKASIDKKLESIDRIWETIIKIRNKTPAIMIYLDVLRVEEYSTIATNPKMKSMAEELNYEKIGKIAIEMDSGIEKIRPYIGEYLWAIFYAYRAITLRTLLLMHLGVNQVEKLNWHEDGGIRSLIASVLTKKQVEHFDDQEFGKFKLLTNSLETMMLKAMHKIISGEEFSNEMLSQAETISRKAHELINRKS